MYFYTLTK